MTAIRNQTTKVYVADLTKCGSRAGFYRIISRAFGINGGFIGENAFWNELCRRVGVIASSPYPVRIRISGLEAAEAIYPEGVLFLLKILNALEETAPDLRAMAS